MANQKQGLDYFDLSVDFFDDDKIALVEAKYGIKGTYIAMRLLAKIYRFGFYLQWGEDEAALFARSIGNGLSAGLARDVVEELVRRGFFDKAMLDSFSILTSKGIQQRYFNAIKRRSPVSVDGRYLLIDVSRIQNVNIMYAESQIMHAESEIMSTESKKERSKERIRVEESRVEESRTPPQTPPRGKREAGVSEERGGAFSFSQFLTTDMASVRLSLADAGEDMDEVWEFCRLLSAPELGAGYGIPIARQFQAHKSPMPLYEVIQQHQAMEEAGRIHPMPYRQFQTLLYLNQNTAKSDCDSIMLTIGTPPDSRLTDELCRAVDECRRPGSSINQPGKFILSRLRQIKYPAK